MQVEDMLSKLSIEEREFLSSFIIENEMYVWHLLVQHQLLVDGCYAFPNGDIWHIEDYNKFLDI